ncbi:MAG: divalent-cation tolerance protein CutA [Acidimicrobiales bacterium]
MQDGRAPGCAQVQTTASSEEEADRIATALLDGRLAACVQVLGPVRSRYWWEGRLETATEWFCLVKTTDDRVEQVTAAIVAAHSYDTPEVIVVPVVGGNDPYLRWVDDTVHAETVPTDTVPTDTVPTDTVPTDTVPTDTVTTENRGILDP